MASPRTSAKATTTLRVLWQLSHHQTGRPDGWSGAPDEARWVREDLTPRVRAATWALGITMVVVDGDLKDHIEYHEDYDAFCAPHYEANLHQARGAFWGRASTSSSAAEDDRLGAIFWRHFSQLPGRPPDRFDWNNPNVTRYYAFNLTTANTPGFLVEHGVGWKIDKWGNPADYDYTWLRQNVQAIADVWALALAEFGGVSSGGPKPQPSLLEDEDMALRDEFETFKRDTSATLSEMKRVYNPLYHHVHLPGEITPSSSSEPLIPPVEGALYAGSSADLKQVFWKYMDGTIHNWVNGKEVTP